jgi:hypothetical protein
VHCRFMKAKYTEVSKAVGCHQVAVGCHVWNHNPCFTGMCITPGAGLQYAKSRLTYLLDRWRQSWLQHFQPHLSDLLLLDYVGGWPIASTDFMGLHRGGLVGGPQVHLSRGVSGDLEEDSRIMNYTLFHCATSLFNNSTLLEIIEFRQTWTTFNFPALNCPKGSRL